MKTRLLPFKPYICALLNSSLILFGPTAHAARHDIVQDALEHDVWSKVETIENPAARAAVRIIVDMIGGLTKIFFYAGLVLLVWSVIALILAFKNEDADSKVQAISQISVAIVCIAFSGIVDALMHAVGVPT